MPGLALRPPPPDRDVRRRRGSAHGKRCVLVGRRRRRGGGVTGAAGLVSAPDRRRRHDDRGRLPPPRLVLDADERYDWFGLKPKFTVRGERDLPELMLIHRLARDARLVTPRRRRLTVSARGREALADERSLLRAAVTGLLDPTTWAGDAAVGVAIALVCADPTQRFTSAALDAALHRHLRARWRRGAEELTVDDVRGAGWPLRTAGRTFGWFAPAERGVWDLAPRLTDVGRQACVLGIRAVACGPRPAW